MKRTSDEEKRKKGTFQPVRAQKEVEVIPLSRMPYVPDWICEVGKRIWKEHGSSLLRSGLLTDSDTHTFARYCHFAGLFEEFMGKFDPKNPTITAPNGIEMPDPIFKMAMECESKADKLGRQFGLSPSTRKTVPLPTKQKETNPFKVLKSGTNG